MRFHRIPRGFLAALYSIVAVLTITVVLQNTDTVQATVLFRRITMPLSVLLILILGSGMLSGAVLYRALTRKHAIGPDALTTPAGSVRPTVGGDGG